MGIKPRHSSPALRKYFRKNPDKYQIYKEIRKGKKTNTKIDIEDRLIEILDGVIVGKK